MPYRNIEDKRANTLLKRRVNGRKSSVRPGRPPKLQESTNPPWVPLPPAQPALQGPPYPTFVSKSNIIDFHYCPYAFHLIETGVVDLRELSDEIAQGLDAGVAFEEEVKDSTMPLPAEVGWEDLIAADEIIYGIPTLTNRELRLRGRPDGVRTAFGSLIPIEVKRYGSSRPSVRLELAFYWLLLEPYRRKTRKAQTKRRATPRGIVVSPSSDELGIGQTEREIDLLPEDFAAVYRLIAAVRFARRDGVLPAFCQCRVCISRIEVREAIGSSSAFSVISGVGSKRKDALSRAGVHTVDQLMLTRSSDVVLALREERTRVTVPMVDSWKYHCIAYRTGTPVFFGERNFGARRYLALDLEYSDQIWLFGVLLVDRDRKTMEPFQLWADRHEDRKQAIRRLSDLLKDHNELPLVTWGGLTADLPRLRKAFSRYKISSLFEDIERRHIDLLTIARDCVRLPTRDLSLDTVTTFLKYPRFSPIQGGFEASMLYDRYRFSRNKSVRESLRSQLLAYNLDDLKGLAAVVDLLIARDAEGITAT